MKAWLSALVLSASLMAPWGGGKRKIKVAASINDLASIANSVGGDQSKCSRSRRLQHRRSTVVERVPSYMVKVSRAQIYLKVGLQLDQWADPYHRRIAQRAPDDGGLLQGVHVLEVPTGRVDASMGDVQPQRQSSLLARSKKRRRGGATIAEAFAQPGPPHNRGGFPVNAPISSRKDAEATWKKGVQARRGFRPRRSSRITARGAISRMRSARVAADRASRWPGFPAPRAICRNWSRSRSREACAR
jgi:hypothetical protein